MAHKAAWTPVYWDDWLGDTQDLSLLEHGAYFRLMAAYYANNGHLPADSRRLYRVTGALEAEEQEAVDLIVARFFGSDGHQLTHRRADTELAKIAEKRQQAQAAAARRHADEDADAPAGGGADAPADASTGQPASAPATRARGPQPTPHTPQEENPPPNSPEDVSPSARAPTSGAPRTNGAGQRFDEFWSQYPSGHRKAKKRCREIWVRKRLDERADEILADLMRRPEQDDQWLQGYIPNPSTYLNQERWQDDFRRPGGSARKTPAERAAEAAEERDRKLASGGQRS